MRVRYTGATDAQVNYFGNADPRGILKEGESYEILHKQVHDWHTDIFLKEFPEHAFNSVCFEEIEEDKMTPTPEYEKMIKDAIAEGSALMKVEWDRCGVCGNYLAESVHKGCVEGNCSMRPRPGTRYDKGINCPSLLCTFYTKTKESKFEELITHMRERHHLDVDSANKICDRRKSEEPHVCGNCLQTWNRRKG